MRLRVVPAAEREALKAAFWYNKQRAGLGDEFLAEVDECVADISADPHRHSRVELKRSKRDLRLFFGGALFLRRLL